MNTSTLLAASGLSIMLATLNMFGVIAICLGAAAMIIWLVPKPLRDGVYSLIARNRYRLSGGPACDDEACSLHQ